MSNYLRLFEKTEGVYRKSDLNPHEKKKLTAFMASKGMRTGTVYNRFFRDGFKKWELLGINSVINALYPSYKGIPEHFYRNMETKRVVKDRMKELGMSEKTVIERFKQWNFKPYEVNGIINCLKELDETV